VVVIANKPLFIPTKYTYAISDSESLILIV